MPEEVLFEEERRESRDGIAAYLHTVAEKLEAGEPITFAAGERSFTVEVPDRPEFEVKVERESRPGEAAGSMSVEFEIEWDEGGDAGELHIE